MDRPDEKKHIVTIVLFLTLLVGMGAAFLIHKDRAFSENENRVLADFPDFTVKNVLSGDFQSAFDTYVSDQFPGRDLFMTAASEFKYRIGMRDIGGAVIGAEDYYFAELEQIDTTQYEKNLTLLETFFERAEDTVGKEHIRLMLVPDSAYMNRDKLPFCYPVVDEAVWLDALPAQIDAVFVDVRAALEACTEQTFYRTDHHWTSYGAYAAYQEYMRSYGKEPETFGFLSGTKKFLGTLYSKVLLAKNRKASKKDTVMLPDVDTESVSVICDGEPKSLYVMENLTQKDAYTVFLGGNYGTVQIEGTGEGTLVLIKDSYANCFVPFLTDVYGKIIMIDLRYFMGSVNDVMEENSATDLLVLYYFSNFASANHFAKLLLE